MMVANTLATLLKGSLGFSAFANTTQIVGVATSIIQEFAAAVVTNAPGTIVGIAPPSGGPLSAGAGTGGVITGMTGASLAARMVTNCGFPGTTPQLLGWAGAMTTHFMTGLVSFVPGTITGTCTNTGSPSPGPLVAGAGTNGLIAGYAGPTLAATMATGLLQPAPSPELTQFASDLVAYIMTNARATYAPGSITAVCPSGGGPITAGAGAGGTIA